MGICNVLCAVSSYPPSYINATIYHFFNYGGGKITGYEVLTVGIKFDALVKHVTKEGISAAIPCPLQQTPLHGRVNNKVDANNYWKQVYGTNMDKKCIHKD